MIPYKFTIVNDSDWQVFIRDLFWLCPWNIFNTSEVILYSSIIVMVIVIRTVIVIVIVLWISSWPPSSDDPQLSARAFAVLQILPTFANDITYEELQQDFCPIWRINPLKVFHDAKERVRFGEGNDTQPLLRRSLSRREIQQKAASFYKWSNELKLGHCWNLHSKNPI